MKSSYTEFQVPKLSGFPYFPRRAPVYANNVYDPRRPPQTWFFMQRREWYFFGLACVVAAIFTYPLYRNLSMWIGVAVPLSIFVFINASAASRYCVPYPQIFLIVYCLQHLLAPWAAWYLPIGHDHYDIGYHISDYYDYVAPAGVALGFGIFLPLYFRGSPQNVRQAVVHRADNDQHTGLEKELHYLLYIGLIATFLTPFVPGVFSFFLTLLGYIRYIAVFGFIVNQYPCWKSRSLIVLGLELLLALRYGSFHLSALWVTSFVFILAFRRQWGMKRITGVMLSGLLALVVLQGVKREYRSYVWYGVKETTDTNLVLFSKLVWHALKSPFLALSPDNLSFVILRLNQGWIVNRVMVWTPSQEPYANGETIKRTIASSLLPRFLEPSKYQAGGVEYFERFTGHKLIGSTSMGLGYTGEMYANFGFSGGIAALFFYGLFIGSVFRWFYKKASVNPFWWAWAAYVMTIAIKAEGSTGLIVNWMVKAILVMLVVIWLFPAIRRCLFNDTFQIHRE